MKAFTALFDRLFVTPGADNQITLIRDYLRQTPDPERGYALALLTGSMTLRMTRPAVIRATVEERADGALLAMSLDYVGDLAETVSLLWPAAKTNRSAPSLSELVDLLPQSPKADIPAMLAGWLDACKPAERYVLLRLLTGGSLRAGVPASRIKAAIAAMSESITADEVEEVWHAFTPPYDDLFAWIEARGARPDTDGKPVFRPFMHGTEVSAETVENRAPDADWLVEFLWNGARVQWVQAGGVVRLFSRDGDDLSPAFPELTSPLPVDVVLDGQLMVDRRTGTGTELGTAEDLERRVQRKTATSAMLRDRPARLKVFDVLAVEGEDLRGLPLRDRRMRLERLAREHGLDPSPLLDPASVVELHQGLAAVAGTKGLILKRGDRPYGARGLGLRAGANRGDDWLKWPRAAHRFSAVLLYVQRTAGGPSAAFHEFTLGAVTEDTEGPSLVPIGKVSPTGLTAEELAQISAFAKENTRERFGPVRSIEAGIVLEVACERIEGSARRKSGLRLITPRLLCVRQDVPWQHAHTLQSLLNLIA